MQKLDSITSTTNTSLGTVLFAISGPNYSLPNGICHLWQYPIAKGNREELN